MRKNRKLVAILTLLMFAVVMVMPAAGTAAVTGNEAATDETIAYNEGTATVTLSGLEETGAETYTVVDKDDSGATVATAPETITGVETATVTLTDIPVNTSANDKVYNFGVNSTNGDTDEVTLDVVTFTVTVEADPVAVADAAVADSISTNGSFLELKKNEVKAEEEFDVVVALREADARTPVDTSDYPQTVYLWAEQNGTLSTDAIESLKAENGVDGAVAESDKAGIYAFDVEDDNGVAELKIAFARAGDFQVFATTEDAPGALDQDALNTLPKFTVADGTSRNVKVNPATVKATDIKVAAPWEDGDSSKDFNVDTNKTETAIVIAANGIEKTDVEVTVFEDDVNVGQGKEVKFEVTSGFTLDKTSVTTDYRGIAKVKVSADTERTGKLYIDVDGVRVTIPLTAQAIVASDIEKTKEPSHDLAKDEEIGEAFRFRVLDAQGGTITDIKHVGGADGLNDISPLAKEDYLSIKTPSGANVESEDLELVQVRGYDDNPTGEYYVNFPEALDTVGDYTLTVALDNGKKVVYNFTVANFGTAKELVIDYGTETVELGGYLGEPDIYFLDENGVRKDAARYVDLGATGYALSSLGDNGEVHVKSDEKYLGSQITVFAVAEQEGLTAKAILNVTDGNGYLTFNQNVGPVVANNRVDFQIKDEAGNVVAPGTNSEIISATAIVVSQTNPDAKIAANVARYSFSDLLESGNGVMNVTSDLPGDAEILVNLMVAKPVPDANTEGTVKYQNVVYSGTLNYSFGKDPEMVGRVVVMTIGSNDVVVNNDTVTIDAAPFVNDDWRTMVPFRALAESFGAQVDWDGDAQTVTATLDGVTVVMTVGEETYTVNGVEKTADTAPVIVDDRTLVPVRFPAEAFGFDVLAIYDEVAGATASVLFTK